MNDDVDWNLLAKYLFDECTEEEETRVHSWRKSDPKRAALLRQFRRLLYAREDLNASGSWNTDALWNRIRKETRMEMEDESQSRVSMQTAAPSEKPRRTRDRRQVSPGRHSATWRRTFWTGILATAVFVTGLLWFRGPSTGNSQGVSAQAREFRTEEGERATIRLSDGTRAELNVNSRLTLQDTFGSDRRLVKLEGEAFFEVVPDSTRPFIVQAGGTVTRVLGTAFGVRAYPEDEGAKVVVSEGRVTLSPDNEQAGPKEEKQSREDVMLAARHMARFLQTGEQVIRRESDLSQHLAWMKGKIAFEGASFDKVTRVLERWYSLDITLKEEGTPPSGHLNAKFSGESQDLKEVLSVVATAFRLEYERRKKKVIFRRLK